MFAIIKKCIKSFLKPKKDFRVVALLTGRNEEHYLKKTFSHLINEGIEVCYVDNGSTDRSMLIARSFLGHGIFHIEELSFEGYYDLTKILRNTERLAREIDADWFLFQDADEIREAPQGFSNLNNAFWEIDRQGYNAVNFDEFVFVPTEENETYEGKDYVSEMKYYYFFEPAPFREIKAWKKDLQIEIEGGGHQAKIKQRKIFPKNFILRHYIFLSKEGGLKKYGQRRFSPKELEKGWHRKRAFFTKDNFKLPSRELFYKLSPDGIWNKSTPFKNHLFLENNPKDERKKQAAPKSIPFIVGVGRSGTTLLRMMLDAHSKLAIPPETHFPFKYFYEKKGDISRFKFYEALINLPNWGDHKIDDYLFYKALFKIKHFTITEGLTTFYTLYAQKLNKSCFGDKTPLYNLQMNYIESFLPEARFIHIIRDGRDVAVSGKDLWFGPGEDIYKQANNWKERILNSRRQADNLKYYMEIKYEELVTKPMEVLKKICSFIEFDFELEMLDYYKKAPERLDEFDNVARGDKFITKEERINIHKLTAFPPLIERIGRWKKELAKEEIDIYNKVSGDLLDDLGYES